MDMLIGDKKFCGGCSRAQEVVMTCFVSADLSPVTMSSCIQSQAGCDLMFTHRETHTCTLIVYTAQFPVPGLDLDLFCHGCCDTYCRVSQIGFVLHKLNMKKRIAVFPDLDSVCGLGCLFACSFSCKFYLQRAL